MVTEQLRDRGIRDERVLQAMATVPRHEFVPPEAWGEAYEDHPLPIGEGQTISQPYIVALHGRSTWRRSRRYRIGDRNRNRI